MSKKSEYWKTMIEDWKKSGLSQKTFCQEKQLSMHNFGYWARRQNTHVSSLSKDNFLEVTPKSSFFRRSPEALPDLISFRSKSGTKLKINITALLRILR